MAVCGDHLWIGDKKGLLTVRKSDDLSTLKEIADKHTKEVTCLHAHGDLVASGDAYRYCWVWDNTSFEPKFSMGNHIDRISSVWLSDDFLHSTSIDYDYGQSSLAEQKLQKKVKFAHQEQRTEQVIRLGSRIATRGGDCTIRFWDI